MKTIKFCYLNIEISIKINAAVEDAEDMAREILSTIVYNPENFILTK